nr:hypothetical protein [Maliibacterium massiliense]
MDKLYIAKAAVRVGCDISRCHRKADYEVYRGDRRRGAELYVCAVCLRDICQVGAATVAAREVSEGGDGGEARAARGDERGCPAGSGTDCGAHCSVGNAANSGTKCRADCGEGKAGSGAGKASAAVGEGVMGAVCDEEKAVSGAGKASAAVGEGVTDHAEKASGGKKARAGKA